MTKLIFDDWENTADFLARQIVDDLYRAGFTDAHRYQGVVEKTIVDWPNTGRTWGREEPKKLSEEKKNEILEYLESKANEPPSEYELEKLGEGYYSATKKTKEDK